MSPAKQQASKPTHENLASLDAVVKLALNLKEVESRYDIVDHMCGKLDDATSAHTYAQSERSHLVQRADALREGISGIQAQSIAGALVHAALLEVELDTLHPDDESHDEMQSYFKIQRLISSIKSVLLDSTPAPVAKGLPYLNLHLDRWATFEDCLSTIEYSEVANQAGGDKDCSERLLDAMNERKFVVGLANERALSSAAKQFDPVYSLIERDREAYKAVNEAGITDEEMSRRMDVFTEGWWKLVETPPITIGGAIAQATYVAELAAGETRPTRREPDCNEENGASLVLLGIAKFLQSVNNGV